MSLPIVVESLVLAIAVQLFLCFRGRKPHWKWVPLMTVLAMDLVCWSLLFTGAEAGWLYLAYALAMVGLLWLVGIALAWGIYGLVKAVQKMK